MTDSPSIRKFGWPEWPTAILITVAIICLNSYLLLHAGGFWRDEINVINLAKSSSLALMTRDSFPILMPLLVKGWTAAGLADSDLSLRLLGALLGLGITTALWMATWTTRRAPPLLSLVLLGLNATAIFWGVHLRAYALGSLLIVLTLSAMGFLLAKPTWPRAGILSAVAVLSVQALYQNAVFFASIGLAGWMVCLLRKDKATAVKISAAGMVAAISLLPYWACVSQWTHSTSAIRPGFSFVAAADNLKTVTSFPLSQYVWVWGLLGLTVVGLAVAAFFQPAQQPARPDERMSRKELKVFGGVTLLAATAGYLIFLKLAALITSPWYFLPLMALGAACFDLSISLAALPRLLRTMAWGILIATAVIAIPFAVRDLNCRFTNVDLVAQYLKQETSRVDYVVVTPWYLGISFAHYYQGTAGWDTLPPVTDHSTHRFDLVQSSTESGHASQPVLDHIANTLKAGHQVWIVGWMAVPVPGRAAATVEGRFIAEHSRSFEPVELKITGQTSDYEDVSLLRASGWKTNEP